MLVFLLMNWPSLGLAWLLILIVRSVQFARLCSRSPRALAAPPKGTAVCAGMAPCPHVYSLARLEAGGAACESVLGGSALAPRPEHRGISEDGEALGRVLLVGNGPSIRSRGMGRIIDSFDTVVRFNSFVTTGLEEHTGSRTSLW